MTRMNSSGEKGAFLGHDVHNRTDHLDNFFSYRLVKPYIGSSFNQHIHNVISTVDSRPYNSREAAFLIDCVYFELH